MTDFPGLLDKQVKEQITEILRESGYPNVQFIVEPPRVIIVAKPEED